MSKKEITDQDYANHKGMLEQRILLCKKEVEEDEFFANIEDHPERMDDYNVSIFRERSKVIKANLAAHEKMIKFIKKEYPNEIKYSKEDRYILEIDPVWMMKDERILERLKHFEYTVPILNYLWKYNRGIRGKELKEIIAFTEKKTKRKHINLKSGKKYEHAIFITNKEFLNEMCEAVGCSVIYIQKYLTALCKIGIIEKLGNDGRNGTVYADGYYVPYDDKCYKKPLLTNTKEFREALRSFNPLR